MVGDERYQSSIDTRFKKVILHLAKEALVKWDLTLMKERRIGQSRVRQEYYLLNHFTGLY